MSKNLADVLRALDPANDDHWTADGLPRLDVVGSLAGEPVTRKQATDALPGFTRKSAGAAAPEAPPANGDAQGLATDGDVDPDADEDAELNAAQAEEDAARAALAEAEAKANEAQRALAAAQKKVDEVITRNEVHDPHKVTHDIQDFLLQQAHQRELRAKARQAMLKDIDPSLLQVKSPLDQSMARKKGFGGKRPNFNAAAGG